MLNLNIKPYFDDYDENKGFNRILFRPSVGVQARELNQLQTILQEQVRRFGDHVFKNGAMVKPGGIFYQQNIISVKLDRFYGNTEVDLTYFLGATIKGKYSNVEAQVLNATPFVETGEDAGDPPTIFINVIKNGTRQKKRHKLNENGTFATNEDGSYEYTTYTAYYENFCDGEEIYVITNPNIKAKVLGIKGPEKIGEIDTEDDTFTSSAWSTLATLDEGIYYINGHFIKTQKQNIVVSKYDNFPTCKIGLRLYDYIVTPEEDASLCDNAQGSYNYSAPGAHRYKLELKLETLPYVSNTIDDTNYEPVQEGDDFIMLLCIVDGEITYMLERSEYGELEKTLARRTYDESGDYTVTPFMLSTYEHYKDINDPKYASGRWHKNNPNRPGDKNKIAIQMSSGKAYVKGYEVNKIHPSWLEADKALDVDYKNNESVTAAMGSYVFVTNLFSLPQVNQLQLVNLYAQDIITSGDQGTTNRIGTARVRGIELDAHAQSQQTHIYKLYLVDVNMDNPWTFREVQSIVGVGQGNSRAFTCSTNINLNLYKDYAGWDHTLINANHATNLFVAPEGSVATLNVGGVGARWENDVAMQIQRVIDMGTTTSSFTLPIADGESYDMNTARWLVYDTSVNSGGNGLIPILPENGIVRNASNTAITVNLTRAPSNKNIRVLAPVNKQNCSPIRKILMFYNHSLSKGDMGERILNPLQESKENNGRIYLSKCDGVQLFSIWQLGNKNDKKAEDDGDVLTSEGSFDAHNTSNINKYLKVEGAQCNNITERFVFHTGSTDAVYGNAYLTVRSGYKISDNPIIVTYTYFEHGTGDYISVDSYYKYPEAGNTANVEKMERFDIPFHTFSTGAGTVSLADCIDLRPMINRNGAPQASVTVYPNSLLKFDYAYYLSRIDIVFINTDGKFGISRGIPGKIPMPPNISNDAMPLWKLHFAPGTSSLGTISREYIENKRYTMRDISKIETRIDNLEYYVSLSLLEIQTLQMQITDTKGNNRFKNGFIVDPFNSHQFGEEGHLDYKCSIDTVNQEMRPTYGRDFINMNYNSNISSHVQKSSTLITLPYKSIPFQEQTKFSNIMNINPYEVIYFGGTIYMDPSSDSWYTTTKVGTKHIDYSPYYDALNTMANGIWDGMHWGDWYETGKTTTSSTTSQAAPGFSSSASTNLPETIQFDDNSLTHHLSGEMKVSGKINEFDAKVSTTKTGSTTQEGDLVAYVKNENAKKAYIAGGGKAKTIIIDPTKPGVEKTRDDTVSFKFYSYDQFLKKCAKKGIDPDTPQKNHATEPNKPLSKSAWQAVRDHYHKLTGKFITSEQEAKTIDLRKERGGENSPCTISARVRVFEAVEERKLVTTDAYKTTTSGSLDADIGARADVSSHVGLEYNTIENTLQTNLNATLHTTVYTTTTYYERDGWKGTHNDVVSETDFGDRTVGINDINYMRECDIMCKAKMMMPNTVVYPFFDDVDVSRYCQPDVIFDIEEGSMFITTGSGKNVGAHFYVWDGAEEVLSPYKSDIGVVKSLDDFKKLHPNTDCGLVTACSYKMRNKTDENGDIVYSASGDPEKEFGYAQISVHRWYSLESASDVAGEFTEGSIVYGCKSGCQATIKSIKNLYYANMGGQLMTDENGNCNFLFHLPCNYAFKFKTGERVLRLTDQINNAKPSLTSAQGTYTSRGYNLHTEGTIVHTKSIELQQEHGYKDYKTEVDIDRDSFLSYDIDHSTSSAVSGRYGIEAQSTLTLEDSAKLKGRYVDVSGRTESREEIQSGKFTSSLITCPYVTDPVCQSFFVIGDKVAGGCFITAVNVCFASIDQDQPVRVEILEMENGSPTKRVVPFGVSIKQPEDCKVLSQLGAVNLKLTDPIPWTRFEFPAPVYLMENEEYAFMVKSPGSVKYNIWVATMDETDIRTREYISKQPHEGVLFKSQNQSTWTEDQLADMCFMIERASFDISSDGTFIADNPKIYAEKAPMINNLEAFRGSTFIRVHRQDHGLWNGALVKITGLTNTASDTGEDIFYNGLKAKYINGVHQVIQSELDSYLIDISNGSNNTDIGEAEETGFIAEAFPRSDYNIPFDVFNPNIDHLIFNYTNIEWGYSYTTGCSIGAPRQVGEEGGTAPGLKLPHNSFYPMKIEHDHYLNEHGVILSETNKTTDMSGNNDYSLRFRGLLSSTRENLSPVIDLAKCGTVLVVNRVDKPRFKEYYPTIKFEAGSEYATIDFSGTGFPNYLVDGSMIYFDASDAEGEFEVEETYDALTGAIIKSSIIENETPTLFPVYDSNEEVGNGIGIDPYGVHYGRKQATNMYGYHLEKWYAVTRLDKNRVQIELPNKASETALIDLNSPAQNFQSLYNIAPRQCKVICSTTHHRYVPEAEPYGASTASRYFTKVVNVDNPSAALKVMFTCSCESEADFEIWMKTQSPYSSEPFEELRWWQVRDVSFQRKISAHGDDFHDYECTLEFTDGSGLLQYSEFTKISMKIVMLSENQTKVPKFKNLRIICLGT